MAKAIWKKVRKIEQENIRLKTVIENMKQQFHTVTKLENDARENRIAELEEELRDCNYTLPRIK